MTAWKDKQNANVAKLVNAKVFSPKYKGTTKNWVSVVQIHPFAQGVLVAPDGFRRVTFPPTTNITIGLIRNNSS